MLLASSGRPLCLTTGRGAGSSATHDLWTGSGGGLLPYVVTVAWALGEVIVSTVQQGYPVLTATAGLGLVIVLAAGLLAWRRATL